MVERSVAFKARQRKSKVLEKTNDVQNAKRISCGHGIALTRTKDSACSKVSCDKTVMYMYDDRSGSDSASSLAVARIFSHVGSPVLLLHSYLESRAPSMSVVGSFVRAAAAAAAAAARFFLVVVVFLGPLYTSERRGGVERRQLELKGAEGGD